MPETSAPHDQGISEVYEEWTVPEFEKHERGKGWYAAAAGTAILLMLFSFFSDNPLFAVIIIIAALIFILREGQEPRAVHVKITDQGIAVGRSFYEYDEIKDFSVIHKPQYGVKSLYLNFNNLLRHRVSIPLDGTAPLQIRKILLQYLAEDRERKDPPLSESLSRFFRL